MKQEFSPSAQEADTQPGGGESVVSGPTLKMFGEPIRPDSFEARAIAAGHTLILSDDGEGEIDGFAYDAGTHNGPGCSVCDWSACHHCGGDIEPCDGGASRREREPAQWVRDAAPDLLEAAKMALKTLLDEAEARDFDPPANSTLIAELESSIARATTAAPSALGGEK